MNSLAEEIKLRRAAKCERKQTCYSTNASTPCVRIKDGAGRSWTFPWMHHVVSDRGVERDNERMLLTFVSHDVLIEGHHLEPLEEDLAYHRVEKLRHLPSSYAAAGGPESIVTKIEVRARGADARPSEQGAPTAEAE